jgi:excisionase family DNA binding protein
MTLESELIRMFLCWACDDPSSPEWSKIGMSQDQRDQEVLLTPSEVAKLFRVDPKTVTRWAKAGKLTSIRTLGGHRRYKESEVRTLLAAVQKSS